MNGREGRGLGRGLLVGVAVLGLFILFAAAAVDRGTPLPAPSPKTTEVADPSPAAAPAGPVAAPQDGRGGKPPPQARKDEGAGTAELLLFLQPGTNPATYAQEHGLVHLLTLRSDPNAHVFGAADGPQARAHLGRSKTDVRVRRSYLNERLQRVKCAFVPNDPYYPNGSPAGFPGQWHLGNGAVPGIDIKVPAAWARDITGTGVIVGIVDDGLEIAHPDLAPNYVSADSFDFGQNDGNPSPVNGGSNEDRHGTSVAGVAAARGGNGIGGTGAAPLAGLAGLRIDFVNQTTVMFVEATKYHSNAPGAPIKVKNHSYGYSAPYIESQAERDAVTDSALDGTIHLFAAGNERGGTGEDSNKQDVQSSPDVIAVAAFGSLGKFASYSSFGANVFVTTPSSTSGGFGITTTDRVGTNGYSRRLNTSDNDPFPNLDYTSVFGGTSSATPLATGVMALVKQVQPNLDVRFAKHLLVRTSQVVDASDNTVTGGGDGATAGSAWKTNAAGFKSNQNYGFGLIDADALTQQALLYTGVTPRDTRDVPTTAVGVALPDNNLTGVSQTFSFPSPPSTPLEEVLITLNVTHPYRGDVEVYLTSPAGTQGRIAYRSAGDGQPNINWTFVSNAFWGESAAGTWTLQVRDVFATDVGTWNSFSATARFGQLIINTTPPVVTSIVRAGADPTNATSVNYTVTFSKTVTGVDATDFTLVGPPAGASVTGVSGSGSIYTVTVNTGTGDGTLRLDLVDNDSIQDGVANKLGGTGAGNGNFTTGQSYTIDKTAPAVLRVKSITPDGIYTVGANINVTVDFTEPVTLAGGSLQVTLSTTDVVAIGAFSSSSSVSGTYTVGVGDLSPDLNSNSPLTLTGGTLRDAAGNACVLTIPPGQSLANLQNLVVDTIGPTVTINQAVGQADPTNGSPITFTVTFSETVTGFTTGDVSFTGSTVGGTLVGTVSGGGASYTVTVTGMTGTGNVVASIPASRAIDAANNPNAASTSTDNSVAYDGAAPTVTIAQAGTQLDPTNSASIQFTVTFSEPVVGFATGDVTLSGTAGATTAVVTGGGTTYTVTVGGMTSNGTVIASIAAGVAMDGVGNLNAASGPADNTVTYDGVAPTVTINQAGGQADPTNGSPITFTVTFSEPVVGFATGDVTLSGTAGATTAIVSGPGPTYTVTVSGMTSDGTVIASIAAGKAKDPAGNDNTASTSTDNQVTYDATSPSVTINQAVGQSDPANIGPILFTVTFSETVTGFAANDVSFAGSTVGGTLVANVSGTGPTYTVSVTGMTGTGTVVASIPAAAAIDTVGGNPSGASTSVDNSVTFNPVVPTVTINQAVGQVDPTNGASIVFTVQFNESVNGFATGDVSFTGSTAGGPLVGTVTGTSPGTTFTVTVTGMSSSGLVVASIPAGVATSVSNATGNAASTSADNQVTYDNSAPTVTINQAVGQADPTSGASIQFTVTFSEPVTGFTNGEVSFTGSTVGGTLAGAVAGTGANYTVTVTGMTGTGTVIVSIPASVAADFAGNSNTASTSLDNSVTRDIAAPTVTINQAVGQLDPTNAASIQFTVTFSEPVTGFTNADLSFTGSTVGGTLAGSVSGTGADYTVTVTGMTGNGTVIASIPASAAADFAGNPNTASTSLDNSVTRDVVAPTVTINQAVAQADPTNGASIVFTVTFSETVVGFTNTDLSFTGSTVGGTLAGSVSGAGADYTVTVTGMTGNGTVVASIPANRATDPAGNQNLASTSTDNTVARDVSAPTVTINQAATQADPANASPILFTVVFSENVTGFVSGNVTLGGTAGAATAVVTGGPATYQVAVSGMTGDGTVIASLAAGAATDAAGNASQASGSTDNSVQYDSTAPTVTINQAVAQADPTNASPILFTAVFSEPVAGFLAGDVTVGGTAGGVAAVSGGPTTYTISVTGMSSDGKVVLTIPAGAAADFAGNPTAASTSADNSVTYDITGPTVTVNQAGSQADPTNGAPILFTAVFSESVIGFVSADVIVGGSAGGVAAVSGGPTTYTISVSGMSGNGTVVVTIPANAATDSSGNNSLASTSTDNAVTVDATAPVVSQVTSTTANGTYGSGDPITITVVFSEPVVVTGTPQLTLETGAADAVVTFTGGSGTSTLLFAYTIAAGHVSADLDVASTLALTLNGGTIRDPAGNNATLTLAAPGSPGSLGASKDLIVDTTPPVAGSVNDGWIAPDVDVQLSVTTLSANWSGFSDPESGITGYEWAIGTTSGGEQILPFTPVGLRTTASTSALDLVLSLPTGSTFYVTSRATNGAGLTVTATSDGVTVNGPAASLAPPAGFFAVPDNQAVLLEWLASPSASTSFYRVWWKPTASPWTQAVRVDPLSGLSAVIAGLTNGTPYDFMIKAVDASENESAGVFAGATPQPSITIGGLGNYGSAQAAINAAVSGETVVLGPGTFAGPLTLPPGISLQGSSPLHTTITGSITVQGSFPADPTSTIGNLTITGGTLGVDGGTADVLLDHLIIHHAASHGAVSAVGGRLRAVNCTVMSNGGDGIRALGTAAVRNCIVGKNLGAGLNVPAGATVTYDNVYGNGASDYPPGVGGAGNLTAPAQFLNEAANLFLEDPLSTTVDTGDPADVFSKEPAPNGGRINQGAFGNTRWAASKATAPAPAGGRKHGGGCGLTGLEAVAFLLLLSLRNRRNR